MWARHTSRKHGDFKSDRDGLPDDVNQFETDTSGLTVVLPGNAGETARELFAGDFDAETLRKVASHPKR